MGLPCAISAANPFTQMTHFFELKVEEVCLHGLQNETGNRTAFSNMVMHAQQRPALPASSHPRKSECGMRVPLTRPIFLEHLVPRADPERNTMLHRPLACSKARMVSIRCERLVVNVFSCQPRLSAWGTLQAQAKASPNSEGAPTKHVHAHATAYCTLICSLNSSAD